MGINKIHWKIYIPILIMPCWDTTWGKHYNKYKCNPSCETNTAICLKDDMANANHLLLDSINSARGWRVKGCIRCSSSKALGTFVARHWQTLHFLRSQMFLYSCETNVKQKWKFHYYFYYHIIYFFSVKGKALLIFSISNGFGYCLSYPQFNLQRR